MNQNRFEQAYQEQWRSFELLLDMLEAKDHEFLPTAADLNSFPTGYRRLCNHYGLARSRRYSPALVDRLHLLVSRGHRQLYRRKGSLLRHGLQFVGRDFPRTVRSIPAAFWLAFLLFFGSATGIGIATYHDPVLIYSIMDEGQVSEMEAMYDPGNKKIGRGAARESETDFAMFGYYIMNNISIGFRTFAAGILFGVGSVFFLLFNGVTIGGVAGHLSHPPFASLFWPFVSGHGAFELTAIVICGAAGLTLGGSILMPGRLSRRDSLRFHAPIALRLVMGAALMLLCAAFIEAFWSSSGLDPAIKFWVASFNWSIVVLYLVFCGRTTR